MTAKLFDVEQLLWPEPVDDFMRDHFLKRPYALQRGDPYYYDGLISLADVKTLAFSIKTPESYHHKWLDITKEDHRPLASELFDEKGIIPTKVISYYQQGYTLILNYLQNWWPPLTSLCKNMGESLSPIYTGQRPFKQINADVFLTPPDAQGFLPHYDWVDVFMLQLEGSKHWNLYEQMEKYPTQSVPNLSKEIIGDPMLTTCLNQGDMLYIPAGCPHEGYTGKEGSMHLSLGIVPIIQDQMISNLFKLLKTV
jgi:bifunctional lysine-specific demethylase and histidyl-hydroxylase MINA